MTSEPPFLKLLHLLGPETGHCPLSSLLLPRKDHRCRSLVFVRTSTFTGRDVPRDPIASSAPTNLDTSPTNPKVSFSRLKARGVTHLLIVIDTVTPEVVQHTEEELHSCHYTSLTKVKLPL